MPAKPLPDQLVQMGTFRTRDAENLGVSRQRLSDALARGTVERDARGVYRIAGTEPDEYFQYGVLARRGVPFVISLVSALRIHGMTEQLPSSLWITIPHGRHRPVGPGTHTICTYQSEPAYSAFAEERDFGGFRAKVYSPAKTVADCFKFRGKVGLDVAIEALHDGWRHRKFTTDGLMAAARIDGVENVIRPYAMGMLVP